MSHRARIVLNALSTRSIAACKSNTTTLAGQRPPSYTAWCPYPRSRHSHSVASSQCLHTSPPFRPHSRAKDWFVRLGGDVCLGTSPRLGFALGVQRRRLHVTASRRHGDITRPEPGTGIKLHFKDSKGSLIKTVEVNEGDDILSIAHEHDIDLEGACEGSVACSTCHVILSPEYYDLLPEPEDDENDMLDMAFALTDTSRLGCQVKLTRELDGMTATLPSATRNMFVDGKKPTHH